MNSPKANTNRYPYNNNAIEKGKRKRKTKAFHHDICRLTKKFKEKKQKKQKKKEDKPWASNKEDYSYPYKNEESMSSLVLQDFLPPK